MKPSEALDKYFAYCTVQPTTLDTILALGRFLEGGLTQHIEWRKTDFTLMELRDFAKELNHRLSTLAPVLAERLSTLALPVSAQRV